MDDESIFLSFSITEKEYVQASLFINKKRIMWVFLGEFWLLNVIISLVLYVFLLDIFNLKMGTIFSISVVLSLFTILLTYLRTLSLYKKTYKKDRLIQEKTHYEIGAVEIKVSSRMGTNLYSWKDINDITKTPAFYFIWIGNRTLLIPKDHFHSLEDKELFKELISKKVEKGQRG